MANVILLYYRTLFSQSAASTTMGSLAAYLKVNSIDTKILLLKREDPLRNELRTQVELVKLLKKNTDAMIIAKVNFKDFDLLLPLMELVQHYYKVRIFLCGPFATLNSESLLLENPWLSGIIMGYPEKTALGVITRIQAEDSYLSVNGLSYLSSGKYVYNPSQSTLSLNNLPLPDREVESKENELIANIDSSRGCNYNCSYCHVSHYHSFSTLNKRDLRNINKVIDDIEILHKRYNKQFFIFNDSHFWMGPKDDQRMLDFCSELIRRELDIHFYIYLRCRPFPSERIISRLAQCGLSRVFLGVENASERALNLFNKGTKSFEDFFKVKQILSKYHINIHIGYIVFNPLLTVEEFEINVDYLFRIKKLVRIGIIHEQMRVIPNSAFYRLLDEENLLLEGHQSYKSITYGYKYKYPAVQYIYNLIDKFYTEVTNLQPYDVEYYCVSGILLIDLCRKRSIRVDRKLVLNFTLVRDEVNAWMYRFMKYIIEVVHNSNIIPSSKWNEIKIEYERIYLRCQLHWSELIVDVTQKSPVLVAQLYRGTE